MWTRLAQSLTDVANRPVSQFWVDATLKATILLLATIGATALLRRQSAALRHRLWCLTFAALVMLPGLSAALPQWRLAVLPYSSPLAPREESRASPRREATVVEHDPGAEGLAARDGLPLAEREDDGTFPDDAQRRVLHTVAPATPRFRLSLITLWLGGALLTVSPLAVGLLRTLQLRRKAWAIGDASWNSLLEELRGRLRLARRVELIETEAAVMPMTWGLRRPVVLLPRQARDWPDRLRRIVLLHELAHIKRCDVAFQTLGRLACALYWFHPLPWYALRRLRIERELACDDCVVHTGERATDYAAGLLQVARSYRPIRFAAAVAMAQRSNLEHRLFALFDRARSHLPLSARGARLLLAGVMALVATIAVVRVVPRAAADDDAPADPSGSIPLESDEDLVTVSGRVVDPEGKPIARAKLYLSYANQDARKPRLLGAAGDDGRFQFEVDNAELDESLAPDPRARVNIAAVAEGFGLQWLDLDQRDDNGEYTLRLANDVPIRGRIVDVDGQGIAAAKLRLRQIAVPANGLDGYIEATRNGSVFSFDRTRDSLPGTPDEIALDPDGRFTLRGVGAERVVEILVEGPNIEWWYIKVMTRKTDAVPVGHGVPGTPVLPRPDRVYGAEFGHVAPPSRLIVGTLRDADSGKPIAGVKVQSRGLYSSMHVPKTDVEGRFELMGHPKAPQYELLAVPDGLPYFESSAKIQDTAGLEPLSVEMALLHGTEARGRMTFEPDGQPGPGTVEYHPLRPNPDAVKIVPRAVARPLATATIGTDGRYRLPVLPGPGVLAFRAQGLRRLLYAPAYVGRDELQTFFHDGQDHGDERVLQTESGRPGPAPIFQANYNRLILINPPRGAELLETDVTIESGRTAKGIVYDPDDQPLAGAMASGLGGRQGIGDVRLDKPAFTVAAMHPRRTRELVFRHPAKRWGKFLIVPGDQVDVLHVRLERCGEAEGRLLDTEGMPVAHASISVSRHQHSPTLTVETDDRGIFRIDNLVPGLKYDLNLLKPAQQRGQPGAIQTEIVVVAGERKALGDVGVKARQAIPSKAAEK
jgi:beta-lactamase regulating signal transducer with metallopeptidase domain